jgi:6-phosphogluconolactonase
MIRRYVAYVGSRTTRERNARGEGLSVYLAEPATSWRRIQLLDGLVNPSFLAFDRDQEYLYVVHGDLSEVSSFRVEATGELTLLGQESTQGRNPVHLSVDPSNRYVVIANHVTSTLAVLPRRADGSLGPVCDLVELQGEIGPHRVEQPFAKPHQVQFDPSGGLIAVPDKGLDRTFLFALDEAGRLHQQGTPAISREGFGPRHMVFHPNGRFAYIIDELSSTVTACAFDVSAAKLTPFQIVSNLPENFVGNSRAAGIALSDDGFVLVASNRGHDSVACFDVDPQSGHLTSTGWLSSQGKTPRFLTFTPWNTLLVANEDSDTIFEKKGKRENYLVAETGSPVCVLFKGIST